MTFHEKITTTVKKNNSLVCVGLDSDVDRLPQMFKDKENAQFAFNKAIIDATHDLVCAYKPNSAFYEAQGAAGITQLKLTCDYLTQTYPHIPIILDAKRADIGNTNNGYVSFAYDYLQVDAITIHPYLGKEAIMPFLERKDKGAIILCRTSNPGAGEFQDLPFVISSEERVERSHITKPLYKIVAQKVIAEWNTNHNCLMVIGATYPEEMKIIRKLAPTMNFLVPGVGAQGGDLEKTLEAGLTKEKDGLIINSSRGIIFASAGEDFAEKARQETQKLKTEINKYRV